MPTPPSFPAALLADPAWMAMDSTARGFYLQLCCIAAQKRPVGVLADDDELWRKWCGIPLQTSKLVKRRAPLSPEIVLGFVATPQALAALKSNDPYLLAQQLWEMVWKPQVLQGWQRIDAELIAEHPHLAKSEGKLWSPLSAALAGGTVGTKFVAKEVESLPKIKRKPSKARAVANTGAPPAVEASLKEVQGWEGSDLEAEGFDLDRPWIEPRRVKAAWHAQMPQSGQASLWDLGTRVLSKGGSEKEARQVLAGLINKYGEGKVSKALGAMLARATMPAEPIAFLTKALKNETEGSPSAQRARLQRTTVAL